MSTRSYRVTGHASVGVLLAKSLPGLVVTDHFAPPPGDLRGAHEGPGVVNELQYLGKQISNFPL